MKTITKILFTITITAIAIIPSLFIAGAYGLLSPVGFLQNFFVIGLGIWFLGWTQLLLMIIWIILIFLIW